LPIHSRTSRSSTGRTCTWCTFQLARCSMAALDDTGQIEIKGVFPGPTAMRCRSCYYQTQCNLGSWHKWLSSKFWVFIGPAPKRMHMHL